MAAETPPDHQPPAVAEWAGGADDVSIGKEAATAIDLFVGHLLLERRLSPHTAAAYRVDVSSLATFLSRQGSSLLDASYPQLRRWLAQLTTRGYARSSMARKAASARTYR